MISRLAPSLVVGLKVHSFIDCSSTACCSCAVLSIMFCTTTRIPSGFFYIIMQHFHTAYAAHSLIQVHRPRSHNTCLPGSTRVPITGLTLSGLQVLCHS